jgi:hypothetical protein
MYKDEVRALFSPAERAVLQKLINPKKVQDFLDSFPINFEVGGETIMSPKRVLRIKTMHCIEGALLAAASLAYHGREPLLLDLQTNQHDDDHVVALFSVEAGSASGGKEKRWGAISKTNHTTLKWRDPVYKTVRELAMSYFHEYFLEKGTKNLRAYSRPFNLKRYPAKKWIAGDDDLDWLAIDLDDSPHFPIAPYAALRAARVASKIERESLDIVEWKYPRGYTGH